MTIAKLNFSYPRDSVQTVFDSIATTTLELSAMTSKKVDECVELVNGVEQSAIEATAIVDDMYIAQNQFITGNADVRAGLVNANNTFIATLDADKITFETGINLSLTTFQNGANATKTAYETSTTNSLNAFKASVDLSKVTYDTNMTNAVNAVSVNAGTEINTQVTTKVNTALTDGTITALINTQLLGGINTSLTAVTNDVATHKLDNAFLSPRSFGAKFDSLTDDTQAIRDCIIQCKLLKKILLIPIGVGLVNGTLNVTGITVIGSGKNCIIKAKNSNSTFDIFQTEGNTTFDNFAINGNWDTTTLGLNGYGIRCGELVVSTFSGGYHIKNMSISYCCSDGIYMKGLGYSSIKDCYIVVTGKNGINLDGGVGNDGVTSVLIQGMNNINTIREYGIRLNDCVNIKIDGAVIESTKGIILCGGNMRDITIDGVYQEMVTGNKFVTFTGSGTHINIINCFCGGTSIDYSANFYGTTITGNSNLTLPDPRICFNWFITQGTNGGNYNELIIPHLKVLYGLEIKNEVGGILAHFLDTITMSGINDVLFAIKNNGTSMHKFLAQGGFITGSTFQPFLYGHMIFCGKHIWIDSEDKMRIKATTPTIDMDGEYIGNIVGVPASATANGRKGQMAYDDNFHYVCIQIDVWKRSPLTTW